jgi:membrane fusion protein, multidrug efflux system
VANLAQAEAQRDQAELNLSYTTVTAAQAGRVVNLSAAKGQFAAQGTAFAMFVPDDVWVTANFKETQLDAMRDGQKVTLQIDAYPERALRGHVESAAGIGASILAAAARKRHRQLCQGRAARAGQVRARQSAV